MDLAVGITTSNLKSLDHNLVKLSVNGSCELFLVPMSLKNASVQQLLHSSKKISKGSLSTGSHLAIKIDKQSQGALVSGAKRFNVPINHFLVIEPKVNSTKTILSSIKRFGPKGRAYPVYRGKLVVFRRAGKLRISLILDNDDYLKGVLQSEIPSSYHLEAIKAQAVAARTYSLNPRISHSVDKVNVCDSYLCCQYFGGSNTSISKRHIQAIHSTSHQILTYKNAPILALFSSNAGGHTESYHNCFSDPFTDQFPPPVIPYLTGVSEAKTGKFSSNGSEAYLRKLWLKGIPKTVDSWSHHFKWSQNISHNQLEAYLHHNVRKLKRDRKTAPFVVAPGSGKFGLIKDIVVLERGISGVVKTIMLKTTSGDWRISKELVIRDLFANKAAGIKRLKSARFFIKKTSAKRPNTINIKLFGLGWGHGVGMQQTGAQGWAKQGMGYKQILAHYYQGTHLEKY